MIEICNLRNCEIEFDYDIRVDRASILGNPFRMFNESERDEVCQEYEAYFSDITNSLVSDIDIYRTYDITDDKRKQFMNELRRLYKIHRKYGKLRLFCWCAPKRCHAETIKQFLEKYIQE